jgi:sugar phosphate isomerase/epimerase
MNVNPVSISLSSFGADIVRQQGQAAFVDVVAASGASRIELREELMTHESLSALCSAVASRQLECLYSSPLELWLPQSTAPNPQLSAALQRAVLAGAQWLKVSLGHFTDDCDFAALAQIVTHYPVRLLVENDQTLHGGRIDGFVRFFGQISALHIPVGMTFDVGNWQWQEQSALSAAQQLGRYVEYVHFKAVAQTAAGKLIATAPQSVDLPAWGQLLGHMKPGLPRAIEYPLQGDDLLEVTRQQVSILAGLNGSITTGQAQEPSHV